MCGPEDEYEVLDVYVDNNSTVIYDLDENQHVYIGEQ